jgi:hypothetical protein
MATWAAALGAVAAYYRGVAGVPFLDPADAHGGRFKSPDNGGRIPESPQAYRPLEPLDFGFGEALPPCSSAFRTPSGTTPMTSAKCRLWRSRTRA